MSECEAHNKDIPSHPIVEYHPYTWEHYSQYNNNMLRETTNRLPRKLNAKANNLKSEMLTDPDMGKMAAKDIEQLDANMVNLVNQIKGNVVTILFLNPLKRPYISRVFFLYGFVLEIFINLLWNLAQTFC